MGTGVRIGDRSSQSLGTRLHNRFRVWTRAARRLPDFVVIGANASGTTSFYWNLVRHPTILPTATKEVHFFDRHWQDGLGWYRAHFPLAHTRARHITGEATPSYLFRPGVAARIADTVPRARLIALLRDPVDRAYGHYHKRLRKGSIALPFGDVIEAELEALASGPITRETFEARVRQRDAQRGTPVEARDLTRWDGTPFLLRGLYAFQLEEWRQHFPAEQLGIWPSEAYYADPFGLLREVARDFLGQADWQPERYESRNQGHGYPPMDPGIRRTLREFFRPYNESLYALLGRDLGWEARDTAG